MVQGMPLAGMTQEVQEETSCRDLGCPTESEILLESPFAEVGIGDRVQGEVLPGVLRVSLRIPPFSYPQDWGLGG
jgi:hypothetical protein